MLDNMARGLKPEINEDDERLKKGVGNWTEMESGFKFYSMRHAGRPMSEVLDMYLAERSDMSLVTERSSRPAPVDGASGACGGHSGGFRS